MARRPPTRRPPHQRRTTNTDDEAHEYPHDQTHQYAYAEAGYADAYQNCSAHRDPDQHSATATRMDDQRERFVVEHQAWPNRTHFG